MDGNPHSATAALILQRITENPDWYGDTPVMEVLARAQVEATLGLAWEQRTANLIACSQKVCIRDSPDAIRERLGEAPLVPGVGGPTPQQVFEAAKEQTVTVLREELKRWGTHDTGNPDTLAIDALLDLPELAGEIVTALRLRGCL